MRTLLFPLLVIFLLLSGCSDEQNPVAPYHSRSTDDVRNLAEGSSTDIDRARAELLTREISPERRCAISDDLIGSLEAEASPGILSVAWSARSRGQLESGNKDLAQASLSTAFALAEESGNSRFLAVAMFQQASQAWQLREWSDAHLLFVKLREHCKDDPTCGDFYVEALNGLGSLAIRRDANSTARELFKQAISFETECYLQEARTFPAMNVAMLVLRDGKYSEALKSLKVAQEYVEPLARQDWSHLLLRKMSICYLKLDQPKHALECLKKANCYPGVGPEEKSRAVALRTLAMARLKMGDPQQLCESALAAVNSSTATDASKRLPWSHMIALILQAKTEATLGNRSKAIALLSTVKPGKVSVHYLLETLTTKAELQSQEGLLRETLATHKDLTKVFRQRCVVRAEAEMEFAKDQAKASRIVFLQRERKLAGQKDKLTTIVSSLVSVGSCLSLVGFLFLRRSRTKRINVEALNEQGLAEKAELVSEVADLETALQRKHRLQALGELTSGVAHDFNNLLTVITNSNDLMIALQKQGQPVDKLIDQSNSAVRVAVSLTTQLLAYGGKQLLNPEVVDLRDFFRRTEGLLRQTISPHSQLEIRFTDSREFIVEIDETQLTTAMINLCSNARDAITGQDGGRIRIDVRNLSIENDTDLRKGNYVEIRTADNGCGMDSRQLDRACEPFFTTKPAASGTGLGLSMVHGFVNQSGGRLRITSVKNKHTLVYIALPRTSKVPQSAESNPPKVPQKTVQRVLIVEDDECVRDVVGQILKANGVALVATEGSEEAKEVLRTGSFDPQVILSDIRMSSPREGIELGEWIRCHYPNVRVVLMSGYYEDSGLPDFSVIAKPFTTADLLKELQVAGQQAT